MTKKEQKGINKHPLIEILTDPNWKYRLSSIKFKGSPEKIYKLQSAMNNCVNIDSGLTKQKEIQYIKEQMSSAYMYLCEIEVEGGLCEISELYSTLQHYAFANV